LIVLRIIGFIVLLTIGASFVTALMTGDRRWLRFAWQVTKFALVLAGVVMAFFVFERLLFVI
jgi:hypothetical protein